MNEEYDVIVLGTGLKECILSGLLSVSGKKVLHMDRNDYYGGEGASLNLEKLYLKFKGTKDYPESLGKSRDYNVDLCPKFIMACGNLVKMLLHAKVTHYLDFKSISGSFVYKDGQIHKVPATAAEGLNSGLMGFFQKRKFRNFINYVSEYEQNDPKTHADMDLTKKTARDVFTYYDLDDDTTSFIGHAICLYLNDDYLDEPALEMVSRAKLYAYSLSRYGSSPYIYPLWGLGGLPEGFSRLSAIHGGVYMLNKKVDEILYDDKGIVTGVKSDKEVAKCKQLVSDPTYFIGTDKVKSTGQVIRCICILSHPIPDTNNADSCQIIIPQKQLKRKTDIYISCVSSIHQVCSKNKYIAVVSTKVESKEPEKEIEPALSLLGKIDEKFVNITDSYKPVADGTKDQCFISSTFDETSHFESATTEALDLWYRITGKHLDMTISAEPEDLKE